MCSYKKHKNFILLYRYINDFQCIEFQFVKLNKLRYFYLYLTKYLFLGILSDLDIPHFCPNKIWIEGKKSYQVFYWH